MLTASKDILDISKRADFWDNITSESLIGFGILSVGLAASDQPSDAPDPEAKPNLYVARWLQAWCYPSSLNLLQVIILKLLGCGLVEEHP